MGCGASTVPVSDIANVANGKSKSNSAMANGSNRIESTFYVQTINHKSPMIRLDHCEEPKVVAVKGATYEMNLRYVYVSQRGFYPSDPSKANQDSYLICESLLGDHSCNMFGIFDGHGTYGDLCSYYAADEMPKNLVKALNKNSGLACLDGDKSNDVYTKAFVDTDKALHGGSSIDDSLSGTTGVTVLQKGDRLLVANVGDSRAIIASMVDGKLVYSPLSNDQTPYRKDERERLKKLGAKIMTIDQVEGNEPMHENFGTQLGNEIDEGGDPPRVWDNTLEKPGCAFSRSIGDYVAKKVGVCAEPEILHWDISPDDKFALVASDGVFEFITSQNVVEMLAKFTDPIEGAKHVVAEAYRLCLTVDDRTGDITIIVVYFDNVRPLSDPSGAGPSRTPRDPPGRMNRALSISKGMTGDGAVDNKSESDIATSAPPAAASHARYLCGETPIVDVSSAFAHPADAHSTAPSARLILRGRFQTGDDFGATHHYQCVIKCATHSELSSPTPYFIASMRREHEMYLEIRRLTENGHTGCVRLYSAHPKHHYLVLEDHGADLRALLKPSLRYPQQVVEAVVTSVYALHSLGIVHFDIKPQNLLYKLYDHGYVVKLCDLDAAYKVGEFCAAASLGTAHYHAPELCAAAIRGDEIRAALEMDMFALGLVLWQVLKRSPHAALDCPEEAMLYRSQEKLNAHLDYAPFYRADLQRVTCINPAHRINIADLQRAVKTLSASSSQHYRLSYEQLQQAVGSELGSISDTLVKMNAKLDRVLQELGTRFDALGSSAVEMAESLNRDNMLGNSASQLLPDMIQATQEALQRMGDTTNKSPEEATRSPAATSAEMQECLSTMQARMEVAMTRALAEQKRAGAVESRALAVQLQGRFSDLASELRAHLQEQSRNSMQTAQQQLDVLHHTSMCLKTGLSEVLGSLRDIHGELEELKSNQRALGKQVADVLAASAELTAMVRALTANTHGLPTLAIILPVVSTSWKNRFSPLRLVRDQYRLYFLCSHTHQLAPCGPKGKGYQITMTKQWVLDAAPVLRVGLVLLKVALLASGLPLPVPDLCSALVESAMHPKYLDAALQLVTNPPDGALLNAEYTTQQTLDAIEEHDYSDYKALGAEMRLQEGSRKAYETIKEILGNDGVNIPLTCGLRKVTHRGKTAWVLDSDATERDWRSAVDNAAP